LIKTHRKTKLPASEFLDLLQFDAVRQFDRSGVEQLEKFSDYAYAEIRNQYGDELFQAVVNVEECFAEGGAAVGEPDFVSLDAAVRTLEDQIGVVDRSGFGLRPEFRQKILSPFHLKSAVKKHFSSFSFFNESRLLF
jgi:hypothetical protein